MYVPPHESGNHIIRGYGICKTKQQSTKCNAFISTMFGYQAENRGVGITGGVDFVELDGPTVVLHLKGRFWHQRPTVLQRVGAYLQARIPEIVDVIVADEWELTDEANDLASLGDILTSEEDSAIQSICKL